MATIAKHVGFIRSIISNHTDDSKFTDEMIYTAFNNAANMLQIRKNKRWEFISDWNYRRYCLGLEVQKSHNCDCVPVGCDVLKTKIRVPRPLTSRNKDMIRVYDLQGRELFRVDENEQIANQLDEVKKGQITYSLIDQKITIWNAIDPVSNRPKYKAIEVEMIPEDETDWAGITLCDSDGEETDETCFDIENSDYTLDAELVDQAYSLAIEKLGIAHQVPRDRTNDAQDGIET